jgi:hypothetical protein
MRRSIGALLLASALLLGIVVPASAAHPEHASCLGVGASGVEPGTKDDVAIFINDLADATESTHGQLVKPFAQQKGNCVVLPPVPPHP